MDQVLPVLQQTAEKVHLKYQQLDKYPALAKLNISPIIKPSNIAIALTAVFSLIVLFIAPLGIPFLVICFGLPLKATIKAFHQWEQNQWIILYWVFNALIQMLTPLILIIIPFEWLLTLLRIGAAYYLIVMEGGKYLYPIIKQQLQINGIVPTSSPAQTKVGEKSE